MLKKFLNAHLITVSDPFVRVSLLSGGKRTKKKRTSTKRNSSNPVWNEALVFNIRGKDCLGDVQLELTMFSENLLGKDEMMGKLVVGEQVKRVEHTAHWLDRLNNTNIAGQWHQLNAPD